MKTGINEKPIRMMVLANGPIHTMVKGTKKGKKGYNRKNKDWRND